MEERKEIAGNGANRGVVPKRAAPGADRGRSINVDEVLTEVGTAARRDGRKIFALSKLMRANNARVVAPQTQTGNRMLQVVEELDRALFSIERAASRSFDAKLQSLKRGAEDMVMASASQLIEAAARLALDANVERSRIIDPMVRARYDELVTAHEAPTPPGEAGQAAPSRRRSKAAPAQANRESAASDTPAHDQ